MSPWWRERRGVHGGAAVRAERRKGRADRAAQRPGRLQGHLHARDSSVRDADGFFPGWKATRVLADDTRAVGVEIENRNHAKVQVCSRLLVAADGRDSTVARLARAPGRVRPHDRFFYFAYWRGVKPEHTCFRVWFLEPHGGAEFPSEDGITLLGAAFHRSSLAEARADPQRAYMRQLERLPDGPDLSEAEQISKLLGKLEMPNVIRPAAQPGIAFVGDAGLATDPVFGVGIGFAFQSAEWLVDETSPALAGDGDELDDALRRYTRKFLWRLGPHHLMMADFSSRLGFRSHERFALRKAARDPIVGRAFGEVMTRERSPIRMVTPGVVARILAA